MDNLENKPLNQPDLTGLQARYDALQHLVMSILILVIVISGTLNIYLLRQWRTVSREVAVIRPQAAQMVAIYQRDEEPWMKTILTKLTEYGRTHPDFAPVLARYNLKPAAATNLPPTTPPAPPAVPKK